MLSQFAFSRFRSLFVIAVGFSSGWAHSFSTRALRKAGPYHSTLPEQTPTRPTTLAPTLPVSTLWERSPAGGPSFAIFAKGGIAEHSLFLTVLRVLPITLLCDHAHGIPSPSLRE